jgi:signal transduction histidine kinase/ligand-binding sensor domain-containing protein
VIALLSPWAFLIGLSTPVLADAPGLLSVRDFAAEDGLAPGLVTQIRLDSRGFLWFCTTGGLSRFDGTEFTTYDHTDGLGEGTVYDILERADRSGYWVATQSGLFELKLDAVAPQGHLFAAIALPLQGAVRSLLRDSQSRLWIGMANGVCLLDAAAHSAERSAAQVTLPVSTGPVYAIAEHPDRSIWVGTHWQGLFRIAADLESTKHYPATLEGASFVRDLVVGPDGRLWGSYLGGVARFHEKPESQPDPIERRFKLEDGMRSIDTLRLLVAKTGEILVSGAGGVVRLARDAAGEWGVRGAWTMQDGLPTEATTALAFDPAENLWIGTAARGALRVAPTGFRQYPQITQQGGAIVGLAIDDRARVLALASVAHRDYSLFVIDAHATRRYALRLPLDIDYLGWGAQRLALDDQAGIWVATGKGLLVFPSLDSLRPDERELIPRFRIGSKAGLPDDEIFSIAAGSERSIWASVATAKVQTGSLSRIDSHTHAVQTIARSDHPRAVTTATALARDRLEATWIGFWDGALVRWDRDRKPSSIETEPPLPDDLIDALYFDRSGALWICLGSGRVGTITPSEQPRPAFKQPFAQLAPHNVQCVVEDAYGRFYFGTDRGLLRIDPQSGTLRTYSKDDGLSGSPITRCLQDPHGRLWFADYHGLVSLVPSADPPEQPIEAGLAALSIDGQPLPMPPLGTRSIGPIALDAGTHRLATKVFAINYAPGRRVLFQTDLDHSGNWSHPTEARSLEIVLGTAGRHTVSLRAVTEGGEAAGANAAIDVTLTIAKPIWQRAWFLALMVIGVAALAVTLHRLRLARMLATERMRTRIASDLHDAVGSDLSRISLMADAAERDLHTAPTAARETLSEVARSAREAVREMSDIVWALKTKRDDLAQVVNRLRDFAADLLRPNGVEFVVVTRLDLERVRLDAEACRDLYLLLKEGIANIARHARARRSQLEIEPLGSGLRITLTDDGLGFAPDSARVGPGGHGLEHMRARARRLGGTLQISATPHQGTTIRFECMTMRRQPGADHGNVST